MKKIFLGLILFCSSSWIVFAAYLPRSADTKLVNLMISNIEQLVIAKGDRAAQVAVDTLDERLERETSERRKYILGAVIDRLRLTYDIDLDATTDNTATDDSLLDDVADDQDIVHDDPELIVNDTSIVEPETSLSVGGKHNLGVDNYYQESRPAVVSSTPTPIPPAKMTITLHVPATACDDFHPLYRQVSRDKLYLRRTLEELVNGPVRGESFYPLVVAPGAIQDVKIVDGVAIVNFSSALTDALDLSICDGQDVLDMFNYTVLGVSGVQSVVYAVDGEVSSFYDNLDVLPMYGVSVTDVQRFVDSVLK